MTSKNSSKSQTKPLQLDPSLLDRHNYFKRTFVFVEDDTKIQCITCKKGWSVDNVKTPISKHTFAKRWLPYHITSQTHKDKYEKDKKGLVEAAKLLGKQITYEDSEVLEENSTPPVVDREEVKETPNVQVTNTDQTQLVPATINNEERPRTRQQEIELIFDVTKFMITRHLPFDAADDILDFAQKISRKYSADVVKHCHTSSTTITQVVKVCIGDTLKDKIFSQLEKGPYSILLDASSDLYGDNYLAILVRYQENSYLPPTTKLLSVIEIGSDSTGEALFEKVRDEIFANDYNIIHNAVAICTDGGSNMYSTRGAGLVNRLQTILPNLVHVGDLCHIYNGIAKEAVKTIPTDMVDFIKEVCSYITRSTQRKILFKEFQLARKIRVDPNFNSNNLKEVPKFKDIRWLSLSKLANYVVQNWDDLKEFYQTTDVDFKDNFNTEHALYTNLLAILLDKLHYYTKHFMKGSYVMNHVIAKLKASYSEFIAYLLKEPFDRPEKEQNYFDIVFPISLESPLRPESFKCIIQFKDFFLDKFTVFPPLLSEVLEHNSQIELRFLKAAKEFITSTVRLMKEKLLFTNKTIMNSLIAYWPKDLDKNTWSATAKQFSNIIPQSSAFESELDRFCTSYGTIRPQTDNLTPEKVAETWAAQSNEFPLISKLARALIVLPYTSAEVESTFSKFKVIKSPYRNRLSTTNLEASLLSEQFFGEKEFEMLPEMSAKYCNMWTAKKKKVVMAAKSQVSSEVQCDISQRISNEVPTRDDKGENEYLEALKPIQGLFASTDSQEVYMEPQASDEHQSVTSSKRKQRHPLHRGDEGFKRCKLTLQLLSMMGLVPEVKAQNSSAEVQMVSVSESNTGSGVKSKDTEPESSNK